MTQYMLIDRADAEAIAPALPAHERHILDSGLHNTPVIPDDMVSRMDARAFAQSFLNPAAAAAHRAGLYLHATVTDDREGGATVSQLGEQAKGRDVIAWALAMEAAKAHAPLYMVLMRRYGDPDGHTYPIGLFADLPTAEREGEREAYCRGGKYTPEIRLVPVGVSAAESGASFQVVKAAERE